MLAAVKNMAEKESSSGVMLLVLATFIRTNKLLTYLFILINILLII